PAGSGAAGGRGATTGRGALWLGLLILYVVWGSTYLGISVAVETIPPFIMAAARFLIAGTVLLGWSFLRGASGAARFHPPTRTQWRDSIIVGGLLLGGGMGMVAWGEQTIPSGITALMIGMMPVWVAVFGRLFLRQRLPRLAVVGIVVGFAGVAILVGPSAIGSSGALDPAGVAALIVSPIAWAIGSLYASHRATLPSQPLVSTGAQMVAGGLILGGMAAITGEIGHFLPTAVSGPSLLSFLYLTVIGSLLAFTAYGWLLRVAPLPLVATYAYVNPVVAVILGAIVLGEPIESRTALAGIVIVAAVALIVTARGRMRTPARLPSTDRTQASAGGSVPAGAVPGPVGAGPRPTSAPRASRS
ncbi:MAG: EamA family transporter, partial [Candidatus Limnocylindrales bacterium]